MKKILISLLGTEADLIASSHFINALKLEHPISSIQILTFKRYQDQAKLINHVEHIHIIDQESISSSLRSELYSDAFAINSFFESLHTCKSTEWDIFCNYSNDLTSSYLASYLTKKELIGTQISKMGNPLTNKPWTSYQNFVMPKESRNTLNKHIVRHKMAKLSQVDSSQRLKSSKDLDRIAKANFDKIKLNQTIIEKRVIAINLEHSFNGHSFNANLISSLIEEIALDETLAVVILTQKTAKEVQIINEVNKKFNNSVVSINAKAEALPSIIKNLDLVISLENSTLLIADAMNVKVIEVKEADLAKSSYLMNHGYSIYAKDVSSIKNDLAFIINQELDSMISVDKISSENSSYCMIEDDYGQVQTQINGPIDITKELSYLLTRYYHFQLMGEKPCAELIAHLKQAIPQEEMTRFLDKTKEQVEVSLKVCLSSIRNAPLSLSSKTHSENFLNNLDLLNDITYQNYFTSAAFSLFEARIENLPSGQEQENLNLIQDCLYQLKSDIQLAINIMEDLLRDTRAQERSVQI